MSQKEVFLDGEGDAWFHRNHSGVSAKTYGVGDRVVDALTAIRNAPALAGSGQPSLLEVGCGEGRRLEWLSANLGFDAAGIEPSELAVNAAVARNLRAVRGTADKLPFEANNFDVVLFGFCLYLCDPQDLFRIAAEADRVLKPNGWIVIHDFYSPAFVKREYHHRSGVFSRKMDYRTLFDWHPGYVCMSHEVRHHADDGYTDERQDWVAVSVMRKAALGDV